MNLNEYPYFTTFQRTYLIIQTILAAIGVFVNSLWGIKLYKNNEHSDIFTYNIAFADGLKALSHLVFGSIHLYHNRFSTELIGCRIQGILYEGLPAVSMMCFMCISVDPLIIGWFSGVILYTIPLLSKHEGYVIQPLGDTCLQCFSCVNDTWTMIPLYTAIVCIFLTPIMLLFIFYKCQRKIERQAREQNLESAIKIQRILIRKGIIMTTTHIGSCPISLFYLDGHSKEKVTEAPNISDSTVQVANKLTLFTAYKSAKTVLMNRE
ncbi:hypothetical protein BC833DRAFT_610846 [Globomyces pollinis-pini]|nr:hypothetical protein BC833DRAFT_610846 [Globomyces pollinis-pini]